MNVYFDDTYWGCLREKDERQPGREIRCNVSFQWEGRMWQIPAVYLCPQGLVADLCCRIERQELTNFYEKWKEWEGEEPLLEQENPFHRNFRVEAEADNMPLQKQSGCGCSYRPLDLIPQKEARESGRDMVEEMLMKSYGLDLTAGWTFWRQSFAWAEGMSGEISSVVFTFCREPEDFPGPHFRTGTKGAEKEVSFVYPATGKMHRLTILGQEPKVLPVREFPPETEFESFPEHFTVLHYQVDPELPEGTLLVSDCSLPDLPKSPAASSIAVIGGADGPTSVFVAGKVSGSKEESSGKSAFSSLHYEPADEVEWKLTFRVQDPRQIQVSVPI